jgi:hypothetical protein
MPTVVEIRRASASAPALQVHCTIPIILLGNMGALDKSTTGSYVVNCLRTA